ncbi:T9SS type A sorting domain-containing protein [Adhaeribacter soli]|uniref:T9SS type A sorting domain-containing protein n=1 Tax=Adhaeribacter soli TaxID=2607655 RepID=UPI00177AD02E|nr:T9SS type A sorting domain-containing protein [Adhaeribacter soli]
MLVSPARAITYASIGNGDWNNALIWSPAGIPGPGDDVIINGHAIGISNDLNCRSLTLASAVNPSSLSVLGTSKITVAQTVTVNQPGGNFLNVLNIGKGQLIAAGLVINGGNSQRESVVKAEDGIIEISGSITLNNTSARIIFTGPGNLKVSGALGVNGSLDFGTSATIIFSGKAMQTMPVYTYRDIIIENPVGVKLGGDLNPVYGNVTVKGLLDLNGYSLIGSAPNTFTMENGATMLVSGNSAFPAGFTTVNLNPISEVIYQGNNQDIAGVNYSRLTLKGTGTTKTLKGNCAISSTMNLDNGVTFDLGAFQVNGIGAAAIYGYIKTAMPNGLVGPVGTFNNSGGLTLAASSTVEYNMNGNQLITSRNDYKNLIISNGGEKTILGNITMGGKLTINSGAVLNTSTFQILSSIIPRGSVAINGTLRTSRSEGLSGTTRTALHRDLTSVVLGPGSTIDYNAQGSGVQVITSRNDYQNIVLTNNRMKALQGNITMAGKLTVYEGAQLRLDDYQVLEASGTAASIEILGNVELTNPNGLYSTTKTAIHSNITLLPLGINSNIIYDAMGAQNVTALNYGGLTINNIDIKTVLGNITVRHFLLVDEDATFDMDTYQVLYQQVSGVDPYIAINGTFRTARPKGFCNRSVSTIVKQFRDIYLNTNSTIVYYGGNEVVSGRKDYGNVVLEGGQVRTLDGPAVINTSLDLAGSSLDIGDFSITFEASAVFYNVSSATYVIQSGAGRLFQKNIGTDPDGNSGQVLFPVGTPLSYTPLYLTNNGPNNNFSVLVTNGVNTDSTRIHPDGAVSRTWDLVLETNNGVPNVTLTLQWNTGDEGRIFDRNKSAIANSAQNSWVSAFGQAAGVNPYLATATGISGSSPFIVGNAVVMPILPVSLTYFKATKNASGALLQWETASEKNNQGFHIQASPDGRNFETVGFVTSANSNSNTTQEYKFQDKQNGKTGLWYYRLKQTDFDGTVAFYGPKVVDFAGIKEEANVYPNPFHDQFTLQLNATATGAVALTLVDLSGKTIYTAVREVLKGENSVPVTLGKYPAGIYILTARTETQTYTIRLIKK